MNTNGEDNLNEANQNPNEETASADTHGTGAVGGADNDTVAAGKPDAAENTGTAAEAGDELDRLRTQLQEAQERFLRSQADFDNFRRRTRQEKEEFAKYASANLLERLLPVVDNFERAVAAGRDAKDFDSLLKGVEMIARQLDQLLEQEGLKAMETVGKPFNPEFHQAIMQVESDEHEEGVVVEEVMKGYILKDKVIRPAMVKVSG